MPNLTVTPTHQAPSGHGLGVGFMLMAMVSGQVGSSFARLLMNHLATPLGAAWMRLAFSGVILLLFWLVRRLVGRLTKRPPSPRSQPRSRQAWIPAIAYGAVLITMNSLFYESISRIPVGIAVTIEFLGPLSVAIIGSHRAIDFCWVGLAALGVVILGVTPTPLTLAGVLFALGAACCWAAYILTGARVAQHWQGTSVLTGACLAGGVVLLPAFIAGGNVAHLTWGTIVLGLLVALASSVLPYSLELLALGRISTSLFGILESLAPAVGALAAWMLLGQGLHYGDWIAIACVVGASFGATMTHTKKLVTETGQTSG